MGAFAKWLLHEDQKELFEDLYSSVVNLLFIGFVAILFWLLGRLDFAVRLMKGYWVFWIVLPTTAVLLVLFQRIFRVDLDSHPDAYIISGIVLSGFLQAGWSAFAALTATQCAAGSSVWLTIMIYLSAFISSYVTFGLISAYYSGSLYRTINLPLSAGSFVLFSLWPAGARFIYGWFFELFSSY
jgi:hypothetical protein